MNRKVPFVKDEYFHIYNRGTNKMDIFKDVKDYERFLNLLYFCNILNQNKYSDISENTIWEKEVKKEDFLTEICFWVLMPNHFHLVIRSKGEKETSLFLQRLLTSHSKYFNKKYERNGSLFQGRSQSLNIVGDNYLKYLFSYVHLNPVKLVQNDWKDVGINDLKNVLSFLNKYKYSSLLDYLETKRKENKIINKESFPAYFNSKEEYMDELLEWLKYEKN